MALVRYATKLVSLTYNGLIYGELLSLSRKSKYCFQFYANDHSYATSQYIHSRNYLSTV
jgi:hypothetical protein